MELTLLPLMDDQKCFESVRKLRWPEFEPLLNGGSLSRCSFAPHTGPILTLITRR